MSRIIRKFEKNALIQRNVDVEDNRNMEICLTQTGMDLFHELNERSNQQIQNILDKLNAEECKQMLSAMRRVKKFITIATEELQIRQFTEKDIRYVIDRQLSLNESERKFTSDIWKEYLTKGVFTLIERFDEEKDCMYILDCNGISSDCIAITHIEEETAQLRYFFIEPELRGLGAGKKLLDKALDFCKKKGYQHIFLWTVSAQESARQLYEAAGFQITETCDNEEWGVPVVEEKWEIDIMKA